MKQRHTEEQIIGILKAHEKGMTVADICRKNGISEQTLYRWNRQICGKELFFFMSHRAKCR